MKSRGLAVENSTSPLKSFEFDRREVGANDVALDVKFTGI
jgi:D-arabinose 1-dehydrogenase-like Zn-dependent alcohol dehydrogenase